LKAAPKAQTLWHGNGRATTALNDQCGLTPIGQGMAEAPGRLEISA
jgi:hypothetical protein